MTLEIDLEKVLGRNGAGPRVRFDLTVAENQFVTVAGRSGAGKSTLLRMLAGLLAPDRGRIVVGGDTWFDSERGICLPPQRRAVGFVFQDYSLFPNMTVWGNMAYAMTDGRLLRGRPDNEQRAYLEEIVDLLELGGLEDRYPAALSGGQQQRVALGRALARRPRVLLLDEPLSALDAEMRAKLQDEIRRIHDRFRITTLFVSHSISEMFKLADRIVMVDDGNVTRDGAPAEVFYGKGISSKLALSGEVLDVRTVDAIVVAVVRVGNQVSEVVIGTEDRESVKVGDHVMVAIKAFSPMVMTRNGATDRDLAA